MNYQKVLCLKIHIYISLLVCFGSSYQLLSFKGFAKCLQIEIYISTSACP